MNIEHKFVFFYSLHENKMFVTIYIYLLDVLTLIASMSCQCKKKYWTCPRTPINILSQGLKNNNIKGDESQSWYPKCLKQFILLYYCL